MIVQEIIKYREEGIDINLNNYENNDSIIDLIEKGSQSIFGILEEELLNNESTDKTLH